MAEFRVVIDGLDLPEEREQAINAAIQRAVMSEIADLAPPEDQAIAAIPEHWKWRGIWIGPIEPEQVARLQRGPGR